MHSSLKDGRQAALSVLRRSVLALVAALPCLAHAQADYAREQRWADEITPAILVGDPIYLTQTSGHRFLALHAVSAPPKGQVIVVHGIGVHPDWGLINTLRSALAEQGYTTLSIQMPVLAADARADQYAALFPEATSRLDAAVRFLRQQSPAKIAIVAHSMGARMTDTFLAQSDVPLAAWVAIGLSGPFAKADALRFPVLDLHGTNDLPAVLQAAPARAATLARVRGSGQVSVDGADHFFNGRQADLVRTVASFLDRALR